MAELRLTELFRDLPMSVTQGAGPEDIMRILTGEADNQYDPSMADFEFDAPSGQLSPFDQVMAMTGDPRVAKEVGRIQAADNFEKATIDQIVKEGTLGDEVISQYLGVDPKAIRIEQSSTPNLTAAAQAYIEDIGPGTEERHHQMLKEYAAAFNISDEQALLEEIKKIQSPQSMSTDFTRQSFNELANLTPDQLYALGPEAEPGPSPTLTPTPTPTPTPVQGLIPTPTPTPTPTPVQGLIPTPTATPEPIDPLKFGEVKEEIQSVYDDGEAIKLSVPPEEGEFPWSQVPMFRTTIDVEGPGNARVARKIDFYFDSEGRRAIGHIEEDDSWLAFPIYDLVDNEDGMTLKFGGRSMAWSKATGFGYDEGWGVEKAETLGQQIVESDLEEEQADWVDEASLYHQASELWQQARTAQLGPRIYNPQWREAMMQGFLPRYGDFLLGAKALEGNKPQETFEDFLRRTKDEPRVPSTRDDQWAAAVETSRNIGTAESAEHSWIWRNRTAEDSKRDTLAMLASRFGVRPGSYRGKAIWNEWSTMYDIHAAQAAMRGEAPGMFLAHMSDLMEPASDVAMPDSLLMPLGGPLWSKTV